MHYNQNEKKKVNLSCFNSLNVYLEILTIKTCRRLGETNLFKLTML